MFWEQKLNKKSVLQYLQCREGSLTQERSCLPGASAVSTHGKMGHTHSINWPFGVPVCCMFNLMWCISTTSTNVQTICRGWFWKSLQMHQEASGDLTDWCLQRSALPHLHTHTHTHTVDRQQTETLGGENARNTWNWEGSKARSKQFSVLEEIFRFVFYTKLLRDRSIWSTSRLGLTWPWFIISTKDGQLLHVCGHKTEVKRSQLQLHLETSKHRA